MSEIKIITKEEATAIIETYEPKGLFYIIENGAYIGIDNSTGDAWTEEFKTEKECISWLNNEEVIDEKAICIKALAKWGEGAQIAMVFEEMAELQKELCKHLRGKKVTGHIAEEIADVEIMLDQMKLLFDIEKLVQSNKRYKLARLGERLDDAEMEGGLEV